MKTNLEILVEMCDPTKVSPLDANGEYITITPVEFDAYTAKVTEHLQQQLAERDAVIKKAMGQEEAGEVESYDGNLTVVLSYAYSDKFAVGTKLYTLPPILAIPEGVTAEFEVWQNDEMVASASGPREDALNEAQHYAWQYGQDGECRIFEVTRTLLSAAEPR